MKIEMTQIGIIRSPHKKKEGMPIQPSGADGVKGQVEVFEEFQRGLADLEGFSHIILLYYFHQSSDFKLRVIPFLDTQPHGVFATRAPKRPSPIGLSVVPLEKIQDGVLFIGNVDILDGTPLLDIKPYVPEFDQQDNTRCGWLEPSGGEVLEKKSDDRFE
jgi:tRNA (adenine37-N6)-methyltransferase